jgi:N-methylhydantoinase B/oxoprolinase/acetone carboxylase alpha subunit
MRLERCAWSGRPRRRSARAAAVPARQPFVTLTTPDGVTRLLPSKGAFAVPAGSVIDMITPGFGGFGPVAERDPTAIGRDLIDGYVSAAAATHDYGVTDPEDLLRVAALEDKR